MLSETMLREALPKLKQHAKHHYFYNHHKAEDLVSATILRSIEKQHLLKDDTTPIRWLKQLMKNVFINQLHSEKASLSREEEYTYTSTDGFYPYNPEDMIFCKELVQILNTKSYSESAAIIGCCKASTFNRYKRIMKGDY